MKRLSLPLVVAAVALAAIAAFAGVGRPEAARGDTGATPDTVTTVGHGVVTLVPDQASVSAGVHTQATTAADALARNAKAMNAVIDALKQAGGKDLQTQQVSLYPRSDDNGNVTGYTADNSVSASTQVAAAGALVDAAVAAGANTVSGPTLSVSDQDARYRDALKKAVEDARAKAQALADAGGFGVGPVSVVAEQSSAPQPVFERAAVAKAADTTPVEPGTQDVTADVTVTFRIR
ncbi:MAG TPA: SIMPL domain-containing protein [Gaiellaceae bacterium]|nr:SIMPL domain-containing protein [Gaiellaceae bacterium]